MKVIRPDYRWNGAPVRRNGPPRGIVWHHEDAYDGNPHDGLDDVLAVHAYHRDKLHWRGIAYHLFVALDGRVYQGRPLDTIGAHAYHAGDWIGVCAEGDYESGRYPMPEAQLEALQEVHDWLHGMYGSIPDRRHRDMPENSTACPGDHYPFEKVVAGVPARPVRIALTEKDITVPRQHRPGRAGWWNLGLLPYVAKVRRQGDGGRVDTHRPDDRIVIPVPKVRPWWWRSMMRWRRGRMRGAADASEC